MEKKKINKHIIQDSNKTNIVNQKTLVQDIQDTLEDNYMPYAMSVIVSRAIPEIDGFKPSHRKLLYTMYKMGLLKGNRTKSANVVGQTMKLNPHGDMAIYETMVRLTKSNEALLHPYVDSKGNFGKVTSRDMSFAASRYTEVKLDNLCNELFRGIDEDTVDFVDNYDATMLEPTLLPTTFPNILVNPNKGIAVGMSCNLPSFNLKEICEYTIAKLSHKSGAEPNPMDYIKGPDFSAGAYMIRDDEALKNIYENGTGTVRLRSKYRVIPGKNMIEVYEIPYTTTIEAIIEKIISLIKAGRIKEISDIRDETDLNGLKITIDIKRGTDPDVLMSKLFKSCTLEDTFSCNFNILIKSRPVVLGLTRITDHWIDFRIDCIKRGLTYRLKGLRDELHLLLGLQKVVLDIDRAIAIIRGTKAENLVIKNLCEAFEIDEIQAEFVANIRLKNLNEEFLLNKIAETKALEDEIAQCEEKLGNENLVKKQIVSELKNIIKTYSKDRLTEIIEPEATKAADIKAVQIDDYNTRVFLTKEGYFKKISMASLRVSSEQKLKENDEIISEMDSTNLSEILFFTNKCNVYKTKAHDIADTKASEMGFYLQNMLELEEGERVQFMHSTVDFEGHLMFGYENGKVSKVILSSYQTKTNRKKLVNSMSNKSVCIGVLHLIENKDIMLVRRERSGNKNILVFSSELIPESATRSTQGVQAVRLRKDSFMSTIALAETSDLIDKNNYVVKNIPVSGEKISPIDHFNNPNL